MDVSKAISAKSDQLNAVDLMAGPVTVTLVEVRDMSGTEQPVWIITDVFGASRPFKPSKTVLRVLALPWGPDTTAWVGKRMTLYRDPAVRWAGEEVGGIRVNALSDIDKPLSMNLPTSKGKHAKTIVQPLPAAAPQRDWLSELASAGSDIDFIVALGKAAKTANAPTPVMQAITDAYNTAKAASDG